MDAVTVLRMLSKQNKFMIFYFYLIAIVGLGVDGNRATYKMIYQDIENVSRCIRRMNATHQIGCTSDFGGNTGVLYHVMHETDIDWLIDNGTHAPYVAILSAGMFKRNNLERLLKSLKVNGLLLDHSKNTSWDIIDMNKGYSSDRPCPNNNFGLYNQTDYNNCSLDSSYRWNREGDSTNFELDFNIPVFALYDEIEVDDIIQCYIDHNQDDPIYPLCAVELLDFMHAIKDTPTCMWRTQRVSNLENSHYCDPIGDYNVWGYAKTPSETVPVDPPSVVLAAAQLDSTSLFYNLQAQVGAESVATSFIPLLVAAEAIGKLSQDVKNSLTKDIMFAFFNGESYDYIGSTRMVFDMKRGYFPNEPPKKGSDDENKKFLPQLNVTDIAYFLELRQLGLSDGTYFVHVDPLSQKDPTILNQTNDMVKTLTDAGKTSNITVKVPSDIDSFPLPPASFQQFLKSGIKIPGVILTDHEKEFTNMFYNSRYDTTHNLHIDPDWINSMEVIPLATKLNKVANAVAKTLVSLAGGNDEAVSDVETDVNTTNELLFCFLFKTDCAFFKSLQDVADAKLSSTPLNFYVGVDISTNPVSVYTHRILSYFLGEKTEIKKADKGKKCTIPEDSDVYSYFYMVGPKMLDDEGICVKSTVHNTPAVSPAFIDDGHTSPDWASTKYPTWTESQWGTSKLQLRLFLVPSPNQEWVLFSLGILVLLISFPSVYFVKSKADILFRATTNL